MTGSPDYSDLQRSVMPIVSWQEDHFYGHGTAFSVGVGGLLITARHVLDLPLGQSPWEIQHGTAGLFVVWEYKCPDVDGTVHAQLLPIVAMHQHPTTDLAMLSVEQPVINDAVIDLPAQRFAARLPDVGEALTGSGYPINAISGSAPAKQAASLTYDRTLLVETGTVSDRHPEARDQGLLSFPVVRTDAVWPDGVSGGPVFDEDGAVVGVVSAGLEPGAEHDEWRSYVCLIGPAIQLSGLLKDPTSGTDRTVRFAELVEDESVSFDVDDTLDVGTDSDGRVSVRYRFPD